MATDTERLTLSVEECAAKIGISKNSAYLAIKTGQIPSIKIGSRILIPKSALLAMLAGAKERGGNEAVTQ